LVEGASVKAKTGTRVASSAATAAGEAPLVRRPEKRAGRLEWLAVHVVFLIVCAFFLVPFLWLLSAAFDAKATAYIQWPVAPTLMNFAHLFTDYDFGRVLFN
jgi:ABC-type glycerol-3-phosphate transport system permease component